MRIEDLKINGLTSPVGYGFDEPVLSWRLAGEEGDPVFPDDAPMRYRIGIASDPGFETLLYVRAGSDLRPSCQPLPFHPAPRTAYFVRVTALDREGTALAIASSCFETGAGGAPGGDWITDGKRAPEDPLPTFCKNFTIDADRPPLTRARLYATAAGAFEATLNGKKLGDEYLAPFLTDPRDALQVLTFRMEPARGRNRLEITVGNGWYAGRYGLSDAGVSEGRVGRPTALLAEIVLEYADGQCERYVTGTDWEVYPSAILLSDIYDGEVRDERLSDRGRRAERASYADPETLPSRDVLCDRYSPPLKICEYLLPRRLIVTPRGEQVLDLGQNMAGFLEFEADLPAGTRVEIEYGEVLQNGCFYNGNYRSAKARFVWTSAGERARVSPRFTYCGFRYAKITGWRDPDPKAFRGCVVHSEIDWTGTFETGHAGINRLLENIRWSMKSNFFDLPTDCPQRDERLGWTGDAHIFAPCAVYLGDCRAFYDKFLRELAAAQERRGGGVPNYLPDYESEIGGVSSVWGDAAVFLPMTLWWHYGDKTRLARHYPMMRAWIGYVERMNGWGKDGKPYLPRAGFHFGDWLARDGITPDSMRGGTDEVFVAAAYFYGAVRETAVAAASLGKDRDKDYLTGLGDRVLDSIRREYFSPSGRLAVDTQTGYLLALRFGLEPDQDALLAGFDERLRRDRFRIRCGFAAAPNLCETLANAGRTKQAYDLLLSEKDPSWLFCVNLGATTVWERWNSILPDGSINPNGMNSLNHYAFGAVGEFFYAHVLGIRPIEPGFGKVLLAPEPDVRLGFARGKYVSVAGTFGVAWAFDADGTLTVDLNVPLTSSANVVLPARDGEDEERYVFSAGPGDYHLRYRPARDFRLLYDGGTTLETLSSDPRAVAILAKKVPAFGKMLGDPSDPELGAIRLSDLPGMTYIPHDPEALADAIREIDALPTPAPKESEKGGSSDAVAFYEDFPAFP